MLCLLLGQICIWFQSNGQFKWDFMKNNTFLVSLIGGTITSLLFIKGTALAYVVFSGKVWPSRLIGFGIGIIAFAFLSFFILGETLEPKTVFCLILSLLIVVIQVFF